MKNIVNKKHICQFKKVVIKGKDKNKVILEQCSCGNIRRLDEYDVEGTHRVIMGFIPDEKKTIQIRTELKNKFYPIQFLNKLYITQDEDVAYIDIILFTSSYTNKQLKQLLEIELSIRKDFKEIYLNFAYFNKQTYFIRSRNSILLFEKNI